MVRLNQFLQPPNTSKTDCNPAKTDPCQDLKFDKQMYHDYMYDSVERFVRLRVLLCVFEMIVT
jgi:hypothetical protein